jgi:hypothetical protein
MKKASLRTKLSMAFMLFALVLFVLIIVFANLIMDKQFEAYTVSKLEKTIQNTVSLIENRFESPENWNQSAIEDIGVSALSGGLMLRGIGERPAAAFVRGANVNKMRYFYTMLGGALVGLAGPIYSLSVKAGWKGTISGLDGIGWIALALTIFGGWNPIRASLGAYLFALLQWLGLVLQPNLPNIPSQVLQVAPFPLMILTLLLVNVGNTEWVDRTLAGLPESTRRVAARIFRSLRTSPPASLGVPFENE